MPTAPRSNHVREAALCGALAVIAVSLVAFAGDLTWSGAWDAKWVMLVALAANASVVMFGRKGELDTGSGFIPVVLSALAYGPSATLAVACVSGLPYALVDPARAARCVTTRMFCGAVVALGFAGHQAADGKVAEFLATGFAWALIYQVLQVAVTAIMLAAQHGGPLATRVKAIWPSFALAWLLFGPMAVAYAYLVSLAPVTVLLVAFAVAASHQMLVNLQRGSVFYRILSKISTEVPGTLLAALDAADAYTAQHSAAVASYAYDIAAAAGYDDRGARRVHAAALMHDIGKIGVPESVLSKPGKLTDEEFAEIKKHPGLGANLIQRLPGFQVLEPAIRDHHERLDGGGYPNGKAESEIAHEAQIIAIADTYSAITTSRSYRSARPPEVAIDELRSDVARHRLNADLVETFIGLLERAPHSYRVGEHTDLASEASKVAGWLDLFDDDPIAR